MLSSKELTVVVLWSAKSENLLHIIKKCYLLYLVNELFLYICFYYYNI